MEQILIDEYLGIPATYTQGGRVGFATGGDLYQKRAEELALEIFGVTDFFSLTDRIQDVLYNRAKNEIEGKIKKAHGGRVGFKTGGIANQNMIATLFDKS